MEDEGEGRADGTHCHAWRYNSRMTVDPRIPTMPARSSSGFDPPGRHCLHQVRSAVSCSAIRMESKLHPTKNRLCGRLGHLVRSFLTYG